VFEIGNSLREARLRQHLDFPELEQATKIRAKYLRALEEERFDQLPSQTYVKGFLRSYSQYLGLEGQLFVDEYNSRFVATDEELQLRPRRSSARPPRQREHRRVERNVVVLVLVAIVVVAALVIAAWRFGGPAKTSIPNLRPATPSQHAKAASKHGLVIRAVDGNSLVQVHLGDRNGKLVQTGTLEAGGDAWGFNSVRRKNHSTWATSAGWGPVLWIYASNPENLSMRLNGRLVPVGGGKPRYFRVTPRQIFLDNAR
jgi:cytoskeleton protein RodZ